VGVTIGVQKTVCAVIQITPKVVIVQKWSIIPLMQPYFSAGKIFNVMPKEKIVRKLSISISVAILLASCATAYQHQGFSGGFSETQLGENVFQVSFKGNAYTSRERVADFNLLRSAEVALENGFSYFLIVDSERYSTTGAYTTPTTSHTTGSAHVYGNYAYGSATTRTTGGQTYCYSKPTSVNTIFCFRNKPEIDGLVYDAAFIVRSIKSKYQIKD
jgi:hypothetical protein